MLYHLLYPLRDLFFGFNVFRYITFRAAGAVLTAMIISLVFGPWLIAKIKMMQIGQHIREEGPAAHKEKSGTPTMGGVLILAAVFTATLLWADLTNPFVWIAVLTTAAFGTVGFLDDYLMVVKKRSRGLSAKSKFIFQMVLSLFAATVLYYMACNGSFTTKMGVPFLKMMPEAGWLFIPLSVLVITGCSNAVNLTDGLDGLAIGSVLIASATYSILVYIAGHALVASYLNVINVKGSAEITVFCGSLVGASLGFLWFNSHPAEIFMGDTGSLSLGAAIGVTSIIIRQELLLVLVGGLFVVEAMSVIIQVSSFRLRGKRVFKMAPIHHHFELKGWAESKVIIRFWIIAILFSLLSLSSLKLR